MLHVTDTILDVHRINPLYFIVHEFNHDWETIPGTINIYRGLDKWGVNWYFLNNMSRPTRKPTLWSLRKVSTRISLSMQRRLTRKDTLRLLWIFASGIITPNLYPNETEYVGPD